MNIYDKLDCLYEERCNLLLNLSHTQGFGWFDEQYHNEITDKLVVVERKIEDLQDQIVAQRLERARTGGEI